MSLLPLNIEQLSNNIEYNIILSLYNKNKNNTDNAPLVNQIAEKYKQLYKSDITSNNVPLKISGYVIPKGADLTTLYINKIKEVCNSLNINVVVDPLDNSISSKDYLILTANNNNLVSQISSVNHGIDSTLLINGITQLSNDEMNAFNIAISSKKIPSNSIIICEEDTPMAKMLSNPAFASRANTAHIINIQLSLRSQKF